MIWKNDINLGLLNSYSAKTMVKNLGIEFITHGEDFLTARMPVDHRTVQPFGILHGGASAALAETVGSVASTLCIEDITEKVPVGVELNVSHLNSTSSGWVYGTAKPLRIGNRIHVWNIEVKDENEKLICVSRLTVTLIKTSPPKQ